MFSDYIYFDIDLWYTHIFIEIWKKNICYAILQSCIIIFTGRRGLNRFHV